MQALGALAFLGAGLLLTGCKTAPELTQANAQALIQAKYDQTPAVGVSIAWTNWGLGRAWRPSIGSGPSSIPTDSGRLHANPRGQEGAQAAKWGRCDPVAPESAEDKHFSVIVVTVAANHLKAHDVKEPQDEILPV